MPAKNKLTTKKSFKEKSWNWTVRETFGYGFLIAISLVFLYGASKKTIQNFRLAKSGIAAKAIVVDKQKVGGKGTIDLTVKYYVNGQEYEGSITNELWALSDTVNIILLKSDPSVIRSFDFIKENYSTEINLK